MKARTVIGILVGLLVWWAVFLLSLAVMALSWPALRAAGRSVQDSGDYSGLTTGMFVLFLGSFVHINGIAGWVTVRITRRRSAVWIVGGLILAYAAYNHLYVLWNVMPAWYNLGVVAFIYPFSFLGASLAGTPLSKPAA